MATKQLLGICRMARDVHLVPKKLPKLNVGTIQVKILSQIGPKIDEDGEKYRK